MKPTVADQMPSTKGSPRKEKTIPKFDEWEDSPVKKEATKPFIEKKTEDVKLPIGEPPKPAEVKVEAKLVKEETPAKKFERERRERFLALADKKKEDVKLSEKKPEADPFVPLPGMESPKIPTKPSEIKSEVESPSPPKAPRGST